MGCGHLFFFNFLSNRSNPLEDSERVWDSSLDLDRDQQVDFSLFHFFTSFLLLDRPAMAENQENLLEVKVEIKFC
jgi:hypothetical protein